MIEHRIEGHTAIITINNPPANTWTPESLDALRALVGELQANDTIYAAVITGQGEKFFVDSPKPVLDIDVDIINSAMRLDAPTKQALLVLLKAK